MADITKEMADLEKKIAYYRKQLDEVAGKNVQNDYEISSLRHALKQKQEGFSLLSELQQSLGAHKEVSSIFSVVVDAANHTLGMDKTVVLQPTEKVHQFHPTQWAGFYDEDIEKAKNAVFDFPDDFVQGKSSFLITKGVEKNELARKIQESFSLPYFLAVPVIVEGQTIGILLSGRDQETPPFYPSLNEADVDTFQSIAGLISASIQNMRIGVLEQMDRIKTEFFANISHEFRTPITLTLGPLQGVLEGRYGGVPTKVQEQVKTVVQNQKRLLGLVNQILDLAKLEAGEMQLKASLTPHPNRFIAERAAQFREILKNKGVELILDLSSDLENADFFVDHDLFDKLIFNLLSNATKFTKKGSITIRTRKVSNRFQLEVEDTGIGIKEDQLPHIFDRFRQAEGGAAREYSGTGIGLALVQEVAQLHGGEIRVRSQLGVGTCFEVTIPLGKGHFNPKSIVTIADSSSPVSTQEIILAREGATDVQGAEQLNLWTQQHFRKPLPVVLYVDDNSDLRRYVHELLSQDNNVYVAIDGEEGLKAAREFYPDLILSDLMMPKLSGAGFLAEVRKDPKLNGIPFVLLTAKAGEESKIEGLDRGADDYLQKPFSEPELLARVRNLITIRQQQLQIKKELRAAQEIQLSMLPKNFSVAPFVQLDALYQPSQELSGDFYDFHLNGNFLYLCLADVTSHGTASAQVTYLVKEIFREAVFQKTGIKLEEIFAHMERRYREYQLNYDVCYLLLRLDGKTFETEFLKGGTPAPFKVSDNSSQVLVFDSSSALSNLGQKSEVAVHRETLIAGDRLYCFTDGCYEFTSNQTKFGKQKFLKLLLAHDVHPQWKEALLKDLAVAKGSSYFEDDITVLRIKAV